MSQKQIGGSHYLDYSYQPWDYFYDVQAPYHVACAIKYVTRWKTKNGREDLRKAQHYTEFCQLTNLIITPLNYKGQYHERFLSQFTGLDQDLIHDLIYGNYDDAIKLMATRVGEINE